jgi:hypothetical protein
MKMERTKFFSNDDALTKVVFELVPSDWHDHKTESVWARPLGRDRYRIKNVPFYAYGVSYDDIVLARPKHEHLIFQGVETPSGHSTYRVILNPQTTEEKFKTVWKNIEPLGATYERATDRLIAIDVPPEADIDKIYAALEREEKANTWGFEEAHFGRQLKEN